MNEFLTRLPISDAAVHIAVWSWIMGVVVGHSLTLIAIVVTGKGGPPDDNHSHQH